MPTPLPPQHLEPAEPTQQTEPRHTEQTEPAGPTRPTWNLSPEFLAKPKLLPVALWTALGVALIYLSTWVGAVAFYFFFQRALEGESSAGGKKVLWTLPVASAASAPAALEYRQLGELLVPLPPGAPAASEGKDARAIVTYPEGAVSYDYFPERYVRDLYAAELEAIGGKAGDPDETADEVALFQAILRTIPDAYRFGWDAAERREYAARVLSKMRLLSDLPLRRMEISVRVEPAAAVVLAEYSSGVATVLAVTRRGSVVVQLPENAPAEWKASPALWLPRERPLPVERAGK